MGHLVPHSAPTKSRTYARVSSTPIIELKNNSFMFFTQRLDRKQNFTLKVLFP